ncbi:hypothetical protein JCM8115_006991 [Rhodotorula mucilaginosa]|uniref:Uncharacterized protein n=1 Tax=Rhodotorula mucilaginosa TaxID=5537 RepID=A0A9P6W287_RHOMI|nr:hypothetical protein C6P46_003212 [Rhodotorula mucilaginosa]TKA56989.1 hypothetical protein B0A53_01391 [Rhodotorula sp. CCFEE 5036]
MGDDSEMTSTSKSRGGASLRLPPELVSLILDYTADWELACALGCSNHPSLHPPAPWLEFATPLDRAILRTSSSHSLVPVQYARAHGHTRFTQWGARVMLRFALIDTIDYLFRADEREFRHQCEHLLPVVASAWGRRTVLEWAKDSPFKLNPDPRIMAEAIDEASRHGQVEMLDFWLNSGLPLHYSDAALLSATFMGQVEALEWWKKSGLPLKIGNVLDFASMGGSTVCLDWWKNSGLPVRYSKAALYTLSKTGNLSLLDWWLHSGYTLSYDKEVLVIATRFGHVAVLEWWASRAAAGLLSDNDLEFRFFEIEEALEDSVANKEETQRWWERRGYDTAMGANQWMRLRNLNERSSSP